MDPAFGIPPPSWRVNRETGFAEIVTPPRELFYHDLPQEEAEYWVSQLTPLSLKALFEGGEHAYAGWKDAPAWYIGTIEDRGLPVVLQRMQIGMARAMGGVVEHRELATSHSPFLSQPDEVVELVREAVESMTGNVEQSERLSKEYRRKTLQYPAVRIREPTTWFRFGIPLIFGHLIGRCINFYGWVRGLWTVRSR